MVVLEVERAYIPLLSPILGSLIPLHNLLNNSILLGKLLILNLNIALLPRKYGHADLILRCRFSHFLLTKGLFFSESCRYVSSFLKCWKQLGDGQEGWRRDDKRRRRSGEHMWHEPGIREGEHMKWLELVGGVVLTWPCWPLSPFTHRWGHSPVGR